MNRIQSTVMNKLLDKYEISKTFQGENKRQQNFTVNIGDYFPKYKDDAEFDFFMEVNEALEELEEKELIRIKHKKNGTIHQAVLNLDKLQECYRIMSRNSRSEEHTWLMDFWNELEIRCFETGEYKKELLPIHSYIIEQRNKLSKNLNPSYFDQDREKYRDILEATVAALMNEEEIFIRDFSIKLFGDSKRMEQIESKVSSLLYTFGDFEDHDTVLEECGVVSTPTYVMIKGNVKISISGQVLDLSHLNGDISFSTITMKELDYITVLGERVVTIENLTSFHDYSNKKDCAIYLGGFHNKTKRKFIHSLYEQNKGKEYRHFGDLDAGGFYILEHLKNRTKIEFSSLYMDEETLLSHLTDTKKLTKRDKIRLNRLRDELIRKRKEATVQEDDLPVIERMLELDCKLEQEAVHA